MTRVEMEQRRMRAVKMFSCGCTQAEVARAMGVSRMTTNRWLCALERGGEEALKRRKAPGRTPKLDLRVFGPELRALYAQSRQPMTAAQFRDLIFRRYAVRYDADHMCRIMQRLGIARRMGRPKLQRFDASSERRRVA